MNTPRRYLHKIKTTEWKASTPTRVVTKQALRETFKYRKFPCRKETLAAGKVWTNRDRSICTKELLAEKSLQWPKNSALDFVLAGHLMPGLLMATLDSRQPGEVAKRSTTWEISAFYVFSGDEIRNNFNLVQGLTP